MANINGTITPLAEAKISVLDRGFLYGDSIYEVVRTYQGKPFFLEEHTDRLENSARLARIKISQTREFLHEQIRRTVLAMNPTADVFIRYTITRGAGAIDLDPAAAKETSYVIFAKELPKWNPEFYRTGMKLAVPKTRRNSPLALEPNIKSGNYLNNILAVAEAKELGADDALILSLENKITEASNSNVVFVMDGKVLSPLHEPETSTGLLRGLTRRVVAESCKRYDVPYAEQPLTESAVRSATECFVTSATREVMPVREIRWSNGEISKFPDGGGTLTRQLQTAYKEFVLEALAKQPEAWFKII